MLLRTQRLASKDLALPPGVAPGRARPLDEQAAAEVLSRAAAVEAAQQLTLARRLGLGSGLGLGLGLGLG